MALGCDFLDRSQILEAVYECCLGDKNQQEIYNRFCDRLDARKIPYLIIMEDESYKLELPLPSAYIFTVEDKNKIEENLQILKAQNPLIGAKWNDRSAIQQFQGYGPEDQVDYDREYLGTSQK